VQRPGEKGETSIANRNRFWGKRPEGGVGGEGGGGGGGNFKSPHKNPT
jgi:hypothetical protein